MLECSAGASEIMQQSKIPSGYMGVCPYLIAPDLLDIDNRPIQGIMKMFQLLSFEMSLFDREA